jgi:hypothetical protein
MDVSFAVHPASSKMLPTATPIQTAVKAPKRKFQGQSLGQQKWINYSHISYIYMHYNIKYRLTLTYYSICHYYHYDYLLLSLYIIYYII